MGIDLASRKRWQCGQCTLVRVAWAEPGLPTSGRDMWEDWLEDRLEDWREDRREDWREDLRFLDEVEEVEEVRVSGTPTPREPWQPQQTPMQTPQTWKQDKKK